MTLVANGSISTPAGYSAAGIACGIKASGKPDVAIILSDRPATVAAAFTANRIVAAPVVHGRELLDRCDTIRAVVVNSGNANACTGQRGLDDAAEMAGHAAAVLGLSTDEILVSSTGVIGEHLPMETVSAGIDAAAAALSDDGGAAAAQAILTTDLVPKTCAVQLESNGAAIAIGGIAKGSGMIGPQLVTAKPHATMLAYLTTDAAVDVTFLRACLDRAVGVSFNAISVDGDTSTNDTVVILANGAAGGAPIVEGTDAAAAFEAAVTEICIELAKAIVRDGEGATRLIEIAVTGAMNDVEARRCAGVIANSALCKTAWFGGDPNWGRIVAAAGRAGVELKPEAVQLRFGDLVVVDGGAPQPLEEPVLAAAVAGKEITLTLDLGVGDGKAQMWSCDLSYDYVKINAEYHT